MSLKEYNDQLINGLAHDLMNAQRHLFTYQQIKKNWSKIDFLKGEDKEWVSFLKDSSVQLTVIYLSKIYDSSGERNNKQTRCLRDLLKSLSNEKIDEAKQVLRISPDLWANFSKKHVEVLNHIRNLDSQNFINQVQLFLNNEFSNDEIKKNKLLKSLKNRRNKVTAHNEAIVLEDNFTGENADILISFAKAVLDYLNTFISKTSVYIKDQNGMIEYQITKIFDN